LIAVVHFIDQQKEIQTVSATLTKPIASGQPKEAMEDLQKLVDWLWKEHRTAPVAAGEEMIYTFWGSKYQIVTNAHVFDALVEVTGPEGTINIRPNEQGELTAAPADAKTTADPAAMIHRCIHDIKEYRVRKAAFR
jgi:hypothetical protein